MKRISSIDPERLSYRQPIGWGVFFGLPFYLFFTAVGAVMWFAEPIPIHEGIGLLIFLFFFGIWLLFVVSTAIHWFGRIGVDIDRSTGTVTTSWGLLFPIFPSKHRLDRHQTVLLDFQVRQCGKSKISEYVVLLSDGADRITLGRGEDYPRMRTVAEEIARFVRLPLLDISDGNPRVVDLSPVVRRSASMQYRSAPVLSPVPSSAVARAEQLGDQLMFRMPGSGWGCFGMVLLLAAGVCTGLYFLGNECHWNWKVMAMWGAIAAVLLFILFGFSLPSRKTVIADPKNLTIESHGLVFTSKEVAPWEEVKELRRDFKSISILTPKKRLSIGSAAIAECDAEWLHESLHRYWRG